jgi:Domain of unknown function (DUF4260)
VEGLALLLGAVALYLHAGYEWWLFLLLLLTPDVSGAGYLFGRSTGAAVYDAAHIEALPIALGVAGVLADSNLSIQLALIWLAHIGMDRAAGYGLKYPARHHKDTHLQRV